MITMTDLDYARLLKAIADPTRIGILRMLASRDHAVTELSETLGLTVARVSHHLAILRAERLVQDRREGKQVFYSFPGLDDLLSSPGGWGTCSFEVATILANVMMGRRPPTSPVSKQGLTIYAATALQNAFGELGQAFENETGVPVRLRFGATYRLGRELAAHPDADMVVAVSSQVVNQLQAEDLVLPDSVRTFARGRLAIWRRHDHPVRLDHLRDLLRPEARWVVVPNPEYTPNGTAVAEVLHREGLWEALTPKMLLANDASQTMQFADTDNEGVAIGALALCPGSKGLTTLVPEDLHQPLDHTLAISRRAPNREQAEAFTAYLNSSPARALLKKYGFAVA